MKYLKLFEEHINEIGDRSVPAGDWIQSKYEKNHKGYTFMTKDGERYYAYFEKKPKKWLEQQGMMKVLKGDEKVWETSFGHVVGHVHGYGGTVDFKTATNKGSHFEILSTYAEIMEDFLDNNKSKRNCCSLNSFFGISNSLRSGKNEIKTSYVSSRWHCCFNIRYHSDQGFWFNYHFFSRWPD